MKVKITKILIVVIVIVFIFSILSAETQKDAPSDENYIRPSKTPVLTLNLSSDKNVYHSSEKMELKTTIETDSKVENLTVRVYGIKDSRGNFRVSEERVIDVETPGKIETFTFNMPSCYGCAGVSPGEYEIMMEILQNDEIIKNQSVTVKLEK